MGTRYDFYVGRGENAEWLGSGAWDGYPAGVFAEAADLVTDSPLSEERWREWVASYIATDSGTTPEMGWPWPWEDSGTTDYAYALDEGVIYGSSFGHAWFRVDPTADGWGESEDEDGPSAKVVFPDMTARQNVTFGPRSGVIIVSIPGGAA